MMHTYDSAVETHMVNMVVAVGSSGSNYSRNPLGTWWWLQAMDHQVSAACLGLAIPIPESQHQCCVTIAAHPDRSHQASTAPREEVYWGKQGREEGGMKLGEEGARG